MAKRPPSFTPGPWYAKWNFEIDSKGHRNGYASVYNSPDLQGQQIASIYYQLTEAEKVANAELIAATPDLYTVVEKWVELWSRYKLCSPYEPFVSEENSFILELAKEALAKAKGEEI